MVAFRKDKWETLGGIAIPSYHTGGTDKEKPGQPPYTRAVTFEPMAFVDKKKTFP